MIANFIDAVILLEGSILVKAVVTGMTWAMLHERFSRTIPNNPS